MKDQLVTLSGGGPRLNSLGFRFGDKGTHTSRTMMLQELSTLLQVCPEDASRTDYASALVTENCLGKQTVSTRHLTLQRLSELYAVDPAIPLFRLLRFFWNSDEAGRPLAALLVALARDPLLRATTSVITSMAQGEELARQRLTDAIRAAVDARLNESTLDKVVRNVGSSWTQSGHLEGRNRKKRRRVDTTPGTVAFALVLGYLAGARGTALFSTFFVKVLDRDESEITFLAMDAKRLGLLDLKSAGGVTEVSVEMVLTERERRMVHGAH